MMTIKAVLLTVFFVGLPVTLKTQSNPTNSETPLSAEELTLYAVFLDSFLGMHDAADFTPRHDSSSVNLVERTVPLILSPGDADGCLRGIGFKTPNAAEQHPRLFPAGITKGRPVYLFDPSKKKLTELQGGLLSLSEIGFGDDHHFAVFTFKLIEPAVSGGFYEKGGTIVLRKTNGKWTKTNRSCGFWIT